MRGALGGLTTRGRCLLAAGLATALCALLLDERDLLRVAGFVVALPLLATLVAGRARLGLHARRRLLPGHTPAGARCEVEITVRSTGWIGTGGALLEDRVPTALGARPRFAVERLPRGGEAVLRYPLHPALRGVHTVGPLVARLTDPFGLAEFGLELCGRDRLVVTPVVVPLRGVPAGGGLGAGEDGGGWGRSGQGEDDMMVRGYRHGDDLRKVHWRSTARRDELMVRVEQRPSRSGTVVLLDHRAGAHRGRGPAASLEYAVSLVASAVLQLRRDGRPVGLATVDGRVLAGQRHGGADTRDAMLHALAALAPAHHPTLAPAHHQRGQAPLRQRGLTSAAPSGGDDLVAVLGAVTTADVQVLLRHPAAGRHAVLLDVAAWAGRQPGDGAADPRHAAQLLSAAGWTVVVAVPGQPPGAAWDVLCHTSASRSGAPR
jgi:uncharacterized protein (DUF58 family)